VLKLKLVLAMIKKKVVKKRLLKSKTEQGF
jgi:hypothetical protein